MNKYNAAKTVVDGITFASHKEAAHYCTLAAMARRGMITDLRLQVPFEIIPKAGKLRAIKYIADFVYTENGRQVVEDVKGMKTRVYELKKRLMLQVHGIEIREV